MFRLFFSFLLALVFVFGVLYLFTRWRKDAPARAATRNPWRNFWRRAVIKPVVNPVLRRLHLDPLWMLPNGQDYAEFHRIRGEVEQLSVSITGALRDNPYMERERKYELRRQIANVPENLSGLAWKLHRLHKLQRVIGADSAASAELAGLVDGLQQEIHGPVKVLETLSVSLLKLELAGNEDTSAQLLDDLAEANRRMRDLLKAREFVHAPSEHPREQD